MVGHGVGNQRQSLLPGDLGDNGRLANARRPHQKQGALAHRRIEVRPGLIPAKVGPKGVGKLLLGFTNVHFLHSNSSTQAH